MGYLGEVHRFWCLRCFKVRSDLSWLNWVSKQGKVLMESGHKDTAEIGAEIAMICVSVSTTLQVSFFTSTLGCWLFSVRIQSTSTQASTALKWDNQLSSHCPSCASMYSNCELQIMLVAVFTLPLEFPWLVVDCKSLTANDFLWVVCCRDVVLDIATENMTLRRWTITFSRFSCWYVSSSAKTAGRLDVVSSL